MLANRRPLAEFVHDELVGGVILVVATVVALAWANLATDSYETLWSTVPFDLGPLHLDLHAWVNDGLMAIFFFVVGMEIKRELVTGELSRPRDAAMPAMAALGGMVVPAAIFLVVNGGGPGRDGWGIPMATDIAFVLGALALLGRRVPSGLRLFLLAVAIVDDLGAIVVIALFYSDYIDVRYLIAAVGAIGVVIAVRNRGARHPSLYLLPAMALWFLVHESGVHATVAGVVMGLLIPARPVNGRNILYRLEHRFHPPSALVVVPLFALANAGVVVTSDALTGLASSRLAWGIVLGLVAGKTLGVTGAAIIAQRLRIGRLPAGVELHHLVGGAALAGIGFTVALFVAQLSFSGTSQLPEAKLAILLASLAAGGLGTALLARGGRSHSRN
jgi:NhaA family Na+:H+ antiporter